MTEKQEHSEEDNSHSGGNSYEQSGNFGIGHMSGGAIKDIAKVAGEINEYGNSFKNCINIFHPNSQIDSPQL